MRQSTSPTLTLALLAVVVGVVQTLLWAVDISPWIFALAWPIEHRPWALLTSIFAHGSPQHLLTNLVALVILGLLLERRTKSGRYYVFFLVTGMVTGVLQVTVATVVLGEPTAVLGASGAIFGLFGYVLAGNRLTEMAAAGISIQPRTQLLLLVVVAAGLTLVTAGKRVALIAHFTGLVIGLGAGREHLLRPSRS